jgi:stage IV sporulation protein B
MINKITLKSLGKAQLIVTVFLVFKRHNEKAKQNEGDKGVEAKKGRKLIFSIIIMILCLFLLQTSTAATEAKSDIRLIPVGAAISISVEADGVLVVGLSQVETPTGVKNPAYDAGLRQGDIITHVGKDKVTNAEEFRKALNTDENQISIRYIRAGKAKQTALTPELGMEGVKEIGIWLRSGMAGIGTMTFLEPKTGLFGALGHSVSDSDTGVMLPLKKGEICRTAVSSVIKGRDGKPGELKGEVRIDKGEGYITVNTQRGIFGYADKSLFKGKAIDICPRAELKCGKAEIITDVGEGIKSYSVDISKIYHDSNGTKDMLITVKDQRLTELTGGIVQGMSGSPILQNGRFAGAVTHVLVGDPQKGFGISIEHMLEAAFGASSPLHNYYDLKKKRNKNYQIPLAFAVMLW